MCIEYHWLAVLNSDDLPIAAYPKPARQHEKSCKQSATKAGPEQATPGTAKLFPEAHHCGRERILRIVDGLIQ